MPKGTARHVEASADNRQLISSTSVTRPRQAHCRPLGTGLGAQNGILSDTVGSWYSNPLAVTGQILSEDAPVVLAGDAAWTLPLDLNRLSIPRRRFKLCRAAIVDFADSNTPASTQAAVPTQGVIGTIHKKSRSSTRSATHGVLWFALYHSAAPHTSRASTGGARRCQMAPERSSFSLILRGSKRPKSSPTTSAP